MWVTEFGMLNFTKELQFRKASYSILVTEFGMVRLAKELQFSEAPMWVNLSEIVKYIKELQF